MRTACASRRPALPLPRALPLNEALQLPGHSAFQPILVASEASLLGCHSHGLRRAGSRAPCPHREATGCLTLRQPPADTLSMLAFLVVCGVVVGLAIGIVLLLRAAVGPQWLGRLVLDIQQFDGLRPRWRDPESLSKSHAAEVTLLGSAATAISDFVPSASIWHGTVLIGLELWSARSATPMASGETLRVARIEGLTVVLTPSGCRLLRKRST